jgi:hypothetical protein
MTCITQTTHAGPAALGLDSWAGKGEAWEVWVGGQVVVGTPLYVRSEALRSAIAPRFLHCCRRCNPLVASRSDTRCKERVSRNCMYLEMFFCGYHRCMTTPRPSPTPLIFPSTTFSGSESSLHISSKQCMPSRNLTRGIPLSLSRSLTSSSISFKS